MPTPSNRAGRYVQQATGYRAFVPEPLPPEPPIVFDGELQTWLSNADRDLARLDAIADVLPNPDLFVAMYVRHEAVLSSQIEGTQSTLEDVLAFETAATADDAPQDVEEVFNYVRAMNHGLRRLAEHFPLSLRLIREIHAELMHGGGRKIRGGEKTPGEFRRTQNWIGGAGCTLTTASFVPPPPHELMNALDGLEKFLHQGRHSLPLLVRCGLAHAQFETIHPFLDGNGRVGRLLTAFLLCHDGVLKQPLLYLSLFLKQHRPVYYDLLQRVRTEGAWEEWLAFFFEGVAATADQAAQTVARVLKLFQENQLKISTLGSTAASTTRIHELLQRYPMLSVNRALVLMPEPPAFATANAAFKRLVDLGIAEEKTGGVRNRVFAYKDYLAILGEGTEPL